MARFERLVVEQIPRLRCYARADGGSLARPLPQAAAYAHAVYVLEVRPPVEVAPTSARI